MTDNPPPNQPGTSTPGTPAGQPAKKPRSPVERAVVWGAILILLGVAGVQLLAWYDYDQTTRPLRLRVREADDSDRELKESEVKDLVKGNPTVVSWRRGPMPSYLWIRDGEDVASDLPPDLYSRASRVDHYTWHGVLKNYSTRVHYGVHGDGKEPVVIEIDNPDAPPEPEAQAPPKDEQPPPPGNRQGLIPADTSGTSGDASGAGGPGAKKGKKKKTDDSSEKKTDDSADKTEKTGKKDVKEDAKPDAKDAPAESKAAPAEPKAKKPE